MNKRGQAAMEFLMTYGWAILAAVIVIAVLASFGVFSPNTYVPTECTLSAPWGCDKAQVAANTTGISLVLRNGAGESMKVENISISNCGSAVIKPSVNRPWTMGDQNATLFHVDCGATTLTAGDKFTGDITIIYTPTSGGLINMSSSGTVTVEVV